MHDPNKMDYSRLLGFDMVADAVSAGVNFQDATVGAKLGAKVGKTIGSEWMPVRSRDLPSEVTGAGEPIMQGLGGRTVSSS